MLQLLSSLFVGIGFAAMFGFLTVCARSHEAVAPPSRDFRVSVVEAVLLGEARGEGRVGMEAVAETIRNRMERSGKSAYEVVTQRAQFSCLNGTTPEKLVRKFDAVVDHNAYKYAKVLVTDPFSPALQDKIKGATHYHEEHVSPAWADSRKITVKIGRHIFYHL